MALTPGQFKTERFGLQNLALGAPGAGLERVWTLPANRTLQIIAVSCEFTTAVAAGNRCLFVGMETGGTRCAISGSGSIQGNNTGPVSYNFSTGVAFADHIAVGLLAVFAPLMQDFYLTTGNALVISIFNIQAADVLDSIVIRYKEWLTN